MKKLLKWAVLGSGIFAVTAGAVKIIRKINNPPKKPDGFIFTAHTGCEDTPDNSIQSLKKAIELGVPAAEVDVTFRKDGTPVLLHSECAGDGEGVSLSDAVKFVSENSDSLILNLDLKAYSDIPEIVRIVDEYGLHDRCLFTGVEADKTQQVKIDGGGIPYYLNAELQKTKIYSEIEIKSVLNEVKRSGAVGLNCNYIYASQKLTDIFHENGLKVSLWTADALPVMKYLLSLGPDNITTRRPSKLLPLVLKK